MTNQPEDKVERSEIDSKYDDALYNQTWICFRMEFFVVFRSFLQAMETLLHHDWERTQHSGDFKYPETLLQPLGNSLGPNHKMFLKLYERMKKELSKGQRKRFYKHLPPNSDVD